MGKSSFPPRLLAEDCERWSESLCAEPKYVCCHIGNGSPVVFHYIRGEILSDFKILSKALLGSPRDPARISIHHKEYIRKCHRSCPQSTVIAMRKGAESVRAEIKLMVVISASFRGFSHSK